MTHTLGGTTENCVSHTPWGAAAILGSKRHGRAEPQGGFGAGKTRRELRVRAPPGRTGANGCVSEAVTPSPVSAGSQAPGGRGPRSPSWTTRWGLGPSAAQHVVWTAGCRGRQTGGSALSQGGGRGRARGAQTGRTRWDVRFMSTPVCNQIRKRDFAAAVTSRRGRGPSSKDNCPQERRGLRGQRPTLKRRF